MAKRSRSAKTGRFVTLAYANKHPSTTVTEIIRVIRVIRGSRKIR